MHPVHSLIQVERVPSQLIGNVVELSGLGGHMSVIGVSVFDLEVFVGCRGDDPVNPSLFVLMSRSSEGCSRQLFGI